MRKQVKALLGAALLLALALSLIVVTGCGGGGYGSSSSGGGGAATATGGTANVAMKNIQFMPSNLTVAKGTTVIWTNNDQVDHTVTANDGSFDSGNVSPGHTYKYTFNKAGVVNYYCKIHLSLGMKGTITVK